MSNECTNCGMLERINSCEYFITILNCLKFFFPAASAMSLTWQMLRWWPTLPKLLLLKLWVLFGSTTQILPPTRCWEEIWMWLQLFVPLPSRCVSMWAYMDFLDYSLKHGACIRSRLQVSVLNTSKSYKIIARSRSHSGSLCIATFGGDQLTICWVNCMPYIKYVCNNAFIDKYSRMPLLANHLISQDRQWYVWTYYYNSLTWMNHKEDTMGFILLIRPWMGVSERCKGFVTGMLVYPPQHKHHIMFFR